MRIHVSTSISNWHDKLTQRTGWFPYVWWKHFKQPATFFGLYKWKDWLKFLIHRGPKTVVWCGSDILQTGFVFRLLQKTHGRHICENTVEQGVLRLMLQCEVEVQPLFFSNPLAFKPCYKPSKNPHVWMHINRNAWLESGGLLLEKIAPLFPEFTFHVYGKQASKQCKWGNIHFHGHVPEDQFNEEIKNYQCVIRLHEFDGFAETLGKGILLGQHAISRIRYPLIPSFRDELELVAVLKKVATTKPNPKMRPHYLKEFTNPIWNS